MFLSMRVSVLILSKSKKNQKKVKKEGNKILNEEDLLMYVPQTNILSEREVVTTLNEKFSQKVEVEKSKDCFVIY